MDMHMDGAWGTFWIKSQNGTFIALQMKWFDPKKFQISFTGKKVPFWQFFRMGWDGRPSRIPQRNLKYMFVFGADEFIERLEVKISAYSFMLKYSKITVCLINIIKKKIVRDVNGNLFWCILFINFDFVNRDLRVLIP